MGIAPGEAWERRTRKRKPIAATRPRRRHVSEGLSRNLGGPVVSRRETGRPKRTKARLPAPGCEVGAGHLRPARLHASLAQIAQGEMGPWAANRKGPIPASDARRQRMV